MPVEVFGADELADRSAAWIAERVQPAIDARGRFTLAVSGGSTPAAMFASLSRLALPWSSMHVFQVDERVAPDGDPDRNLGDLRANLLDGVPVVAHLMDVTAPDLQEAARRYAAELPRRHGRRSARRGAPRPRRRRSHGLVAARRPGHRCDRPRGRGHADRTEGGFA